MLDNQMVKQLNDKYGDAFYVLDIEHFENNYKELRSAFRDVYENFNIAYSFKTNYIPQLCEIVLKNGGYAEIVSEMELELAEKVGFPYSKIIWNGPIKKEDILEDFLLKGGTANIDSWAEYLLVKSIALKNNSIPIRIGIRCNFDIDDGIISRFGVDVQGQEFFNILNGLNEISNIRIISLQCHYSNRSLVCWENRTKKILEILDQNMDEIEIIDLGGGIYGKMDPYLESQFSDRIPQYKEYAECVATLFRDYYLNKEKKPKLIIEPGTAIVGDCMCFFAKVNNIKSVRGKKFITVLGSQKNINMGRINPSICVYNSDDNRTYIEHADIVGYTCIEGDILYQNYSGEIGVGDMIAFLNCGSYSIVMKPPFIMPNFPVIAIQKDSYFLVKRKESYKDIFQTYIWRC